MIFLLSGGGCGYTWATLTKVWVALPCGRNLSSVDIAKCDPKFSGWKNLENRQKHQKRRSACVGQADFGKLELNNIRKDSGNSQRLSVVNVINLKHDQLEINMAECSDLRAFVDGRENFYPWPFYSFYANIQTNKQTFNCRGRESWNAG